MTNEELQEVLANKPFLTDIRLRIKYAVFIALIQRGWKGVRTSFSGVLTKNDFVLTLYKSDASTLEMQKPSKYLVPAAVNLFNFPNTTWVLERYNKIYASGRMQSVWDFLYDKPELIDESPTFIKFINEVDEIASKQELELQSLGEMYEDSSTYQNYSFHQSSKSIVETGMFYPSVGFASVLAGMPYRILSTGEDSLGGKYFVLQKMQSADLEPVHVTADAFQQQYAAGTVIPIEATPVQSSETLNLVKAQGTAMSGLPPVIQGLNFSLDKQKVIGEAIKDNLYIIPLLLAPDNMVQSVLALLRSCQEYYYLNNLPNNLELIQVLIEYARAGLSIWLPLQTGDASEAKFELNELLENIIYDKQQFTSEYGADVAALLTFAKTYCTPITPSAGVSANYLYLQMMIEKKELLNVCSSMLSETMTDSSGRLFLHKVYMSFEAKNELRSFFYEEGMSSYLDNALNDIIYLCFDWKSGFTIKCKDYSLVRVPCGYKVLNADGLSTGFILKVNNSIFTYGDLKKLG